jgi:hypothetical protein
MQALEKKLNATIGENETKELLDLISKKIEKDPKGFKAKLNLLKIYLK